MLIQGRRGVLNQECEGIFANSEAHGGDLMVRKTERLDGQSLNRFGISRFLESSIGDNKCAISQRQVAKCVRNARWNGLHKHESGGNNDA